MHTRESWKRGKWANKHPAMYVCVSPVDLLKLSSVVDMFREQDLLQSEHVMDVVEVIHALTSLYERLEEERSVLINIPLCVDMCLNWLLNVYDRYDRDRGVTHNPFHPYAVTLTFCQQDPFIIQTDPHVSRFLTSPWHYRVWCFAGSRKTS